MRILILLLVLPLALPCSAKDVYKSTSDDGVVIYSDTYKEGAERIRVQGGKPGRPAKAETATNNRSNTTDSATAVGYETFEIAQPANEETIRSNEGTVTVGLNLTPALSSGHLIQIYLNGTKLGSDLTTTQFTLNELNRGTHSLQAKVVDVEGKPQISSETINFHLRKASIIKP
ncbi:MAG: DUF4124 domain-containing protein [Pseudomonadota bacterium]